MTNTLGVGFCLTGILIAIFVFKVPVVYCILFMTIVIATMIAQIMDREK